MLYGSNKSTTFAVLFTFYIINYFTLKLHLLWLM